MQMCSQAALKDISVLYSQVSDYMSRRAEWIIAGQVDRLVEGYSFPVPVDLETHRVIVRSAEEGKAMLALWHATLIKRGVVAIRGRVVSMDLPRRGRFRVWVEYHEYTADQTSDRFTSVVYYCSTTANGLQIEMVTYPKLSNPELNPQFAALAMSA